METWLGHFGFTVTPIAVPDPCMAIPFFLGTSLSSFRIAGGLVLLMALTILRAKPGNLRQTTEAANGANAHEGPGMVRLQGEGGFKVATCLQGLLPAAIGVESMAVGLRELFPAPVGA